MSCAKENSVAVTGADDQHRQVPALQEEHSAAASRAGDQRQQVPAAQDGYDFAK